MTPRPAPLPPWRLAAGSALIVAVTIAGLVVAPRAVGWLGASAAVAPAGVDAPTWAEQDCDSDGFRVEAPGELTARSITLVWPRAQRQYATDAPPAPRPYERYAVGWGHRATLRANDWPTPALDADHPARPAGLAVTPALDDLRMALESFQKAHTLTLARPRVAAREGEFPAWEATFTTPTPGVGGAVRAVLAGDRVYLLVAARAGGDDASTKRFFDSFRLTQQQAEDARRVARAAEVEDGQRRAAEARRAAQRADAEADGRRDQAAAAALRHQELEDSRRGERERQAALDRERALDGTLRRLRLAQSPARAEVIRDEIVASQAQKRSPQDLRARLAYLQGDVTLGRLACRALDLSEAVSRLKDRRLAEPFPGAAGIPAADLPAWRAKGLVCHFPFDGDGPPKAWAVSGITPRQPGDATFTFVAPGVPGVAGAAAVLHQRNSAYAHLRMFTLPLNPPRWPSSTVAFWLQARSTDAVVFVAKKQTGGADDAAAFSHLYLKGGELLLGPADGADRPLSFQWPADFRWHHVAVTCEPSGDGYQLTAYRDGARTDSAEFPGTPPLAKFMELGFFVSNTAPPLAGGIPRTSVVGAVDELTVFDQALAARDVAELAKVRPAPNKPAPRPEVRP